MVFEYILLIILGRKDPICLSTDFPMLVGHFPSITKLSLVVAGAYETGFGNYPTYLSTEFLILEGEDLKWFQGPYLPREVKVHSGSRSIVSNEKDLYYIESLENLFYKLECFAITFCRWIEMDQKLANPRNSAITRLIPEYLTTCD